MNNITIHGIPKSISENQFGIYLSIPATDSNIRYINIKEDNINTMLENFCTILKIKLKDNILLLTRLINLNLIQETDILVNKNCIISIAKIRIDKDKFIFNRLE